MGLFMGASLITLAEITLIVLGLSACVASSLMRWLCRREETHQKMKILSQEAANNRSPGPADSKVAWET